jgi:hypothetical protein
MHNGNKPTIELLKNIYLLQQTWLATTDSSFPEKMKLFDHQIHSLHDSIFFETELREWVKVRVNQSKIDWSVYIRY